MNKSRMITMREVFNFLIYSLLTQFYKLNDRLTCKTESKENKLKTSLIVYCILMINVCLIEYIVLKKATSPLSKRESKVD